MNGILYVAMCIPTVLMILAGVLLCALKRNRTMSNHHFAADFDMHTYNKKIMVLFTITGIIFLLGALVIVNNHILAGLAIVFITLITFLILFIRIQHKYG